MAAGRRWSSIFIASVLNSVPFEQDRRHIVAICAALCGAGKLYAVASSTNQTGWKNVSGKQYLNESDADGLGFPLGYEPNIQLGDLAKEPKVQRYHTKRQFHDLFAERFERVRVREAINNAEAICSRPRPVDRRALRAALEFEFDLPYPAGSRMGLARDAVRAFRRRLEVKL